MIRVAAILLAAGRSERFPDNKLCRLLQDRPLIVRALQALQGVDFSEVLVVLGYESERISQLLGDFPCRKVFNSNYSAGLASSVQAGLNGLSSPADGAMICLGDMPLLRPAHLNSLLTTFRSHPESIVAPFAAGRQANPVILPRHLWPDILALKGDRGCKEILQRYPSDTRLVPLPVLGVLQDVDTPEALERLRQFLEKPITDLRILIRGAGELASATAHRLARSGFKICLTELDHPLAIRRNVCFSEAVYEGFWTVEGISAQRISEATEIAAVWHRGNIPLLIDPETSIKQELQPQVIVDGVMAKRNTGIQLEDAPLVIGLGPGFEAGRDVHLVIETNRGHHLGRVIETGAAEADSGIPGAIQGHSSARVLKAPRAGSFEPLTSIGSAVRAGQPIGRVGTQLLQSEIDGVLRGILRGPIDVPQGLKLADIDPRGDRSYCHTISDKARAIAGGVLEAILMHYSS